ncbi:MAG: ABC transporter ATP-binding protein, partial [Muribaculaceae bacterium]|nr:ABC transporter ATP-binding protein [Muribaculaceae bacterium]
ARPRTEKKPRLSFKEKKEKEELEALLPTLEEEKNTLEREMSSGTMSNEALVDAGARMAELVERIDIAEMRLLELLEIEG